MKQVLTNQVILCKKCKHAFIINEEGDEDTCDVCIAETELTHDLINEGILIGVPNDERRGI